MWDFFDELDFDNLFGDSDWDFEIPEWDVPYGTQWSPEDWFTNGNNPLDNWDPSTMGDPSYWGLGGGSDAPYVDPGDNWDPSRMGDLNAYGLGVGGVGGQLWKLLSQGGSGSMRVLQSLLSAGGGGGNINGGTLSNILDLLTGGNGNGLDPAMVAAALSTAYNHYKDSDRYTEMAENYSDRLDPFGSQRGFYQDRLRALTEDPQSFLENDPGYNSLLRLTVDPAMSKMRARGYGNSGNILSELTKLSGDVANKYLGDEKNRLLQAGGAQFGPGAAAQLLRTGLEGSINSRNAALGDIFSLFGYNNRNTYNRTTGGNSPSIWEQIANLFGGSTGAPPTVNQPPLTPLDPTPLMPVPDRTNMAFPGDGMDNVEDRWNTMKQTPFNHNQGPANYAY